MKIAVAVVRILLGLLFLFASVAVLFNLVPKPPLTGAVKTFQDGLDASGYMMKLIKIPELICAIALIAGRYVALAVVVLFPIVINIFLFHAFLAPDGLPVAIFTLAATLFLVFAYWPHYAGLLKAKRIVNQSI
ncbi:MAG: DoxX family protein [Mucilaginibacter polytrichastri]|nr:DoxX family protein [Mucilaginibacter polytrichastri]